MSTVSWPTSSSSDHSSPSLSRPSPTLGLSSSSSSSTTDSLPVEVAEAPPMVEVVREDDPVNAVDRSDSPPANGRILPRPTLSTGRTLLRLTLSTGRTLPRRPFRSWILVGWILELLSSRPLMIPRSLGGLSLNHFG